MKELETNKNLKNFVAMATFSVQYQFNSKYNILTSSAPKGAKCSSKCSVVANLCFPESSFAIEI